jgi:hypothetical protein
MLAIRHVERHDAGLLRLGIADDAGPIAQANSLVRLCIRRCHLALGENNAPAGLP